MCIRKQKHLKYFVHVFFDFVYISLRFTTVACPFIRLFFFSVLSCIRPFCYQFWNFMVLFCHFAYHMNLERFMSAIHNEYLDGHNNATQIHTIHTYYVYFLQYIIVCVCVYCVMCYICCSQCPSDQNQLSNRVVPKSG